MPMSRKQIKISKDGKEVAVYMTSDAADFLGTSDEVAMANARRKGETQGFVLEYVENRSVSGTRRCEGCGRIFTSKAASMYCPSCRRDRRLDGLMRRAEREKEARERLNKPPKETKEKHHRKEVPYQKKSKLSKLAWDAMQAGTSYGKYVSAMEYAPHIERRKKRKREHKDKAGE